MNPYLYGTPTVAPPPGLVVGDEWWQKLVSYGVGRYVDSETLQPYQTADFARLGLGPNGEYYPRGVPMTGALSNPLVLMLGVVAVAGVAYLALK